MSIKTISRREVYSNYWTRVYEDIIERDNGQRGVYGVVEKDPATILVALDQDTDGEQYLWLVGQYRYTVKEHHWEFPQGGWEMPDVDVEELAHGELREETGLQAGKMTKLGMLWIAYGTIRQEQHIFLAEDLTPGPPQNRDKEEHDLEAKRVSVREFEDMLLDGSIRDNCTLAAWGLYKVWRERQQGR
ncbi:MAG: NUDIX hydrolase [Acidobacteria bacterium]|nr:NUDIX hydrolase [Acidobacteriota bacterium]